MAIKLKLQRHMQVGPISPEPFYLGQEVSMQGFGYGIIINQRTVIEYEGLLRRPGMVMVLGHDEIGKCRFNISMNLISPWQEKI